MNKLLLGLLAFGSISSFASDISYPVLIDTATEITANLSGLREHQVRDKVAEGIYKNLGKINVNGEVVLRDITKMGSYELASRSSSACTEFYGHRDSCRGTIRLALKKIIKD